MVAAPGQSPASPVAMILGATAALALVVFDVGAEASFDAPKRLVVMIGIAVACTVAWITRLPLRVERRAAIVGLAALACLLIGALLSPRPQVAFDAVRTITVFAAVPLLCAGDARAWSLVSRGFVAGAAVNAVVSLAQWSGMVQPFRYVTTGGRADTSALMGNTGILGLVLGLAAVIVFPRWRSRGGFALLVLLLGALAVNRSVTGVLAFAAGVAFLRAPRALLVAGPIAVVAFLATPREADSLNSLLTYRLGPWAAAVEMVIDRPLTGFGAGTFAAEFAPHLIEGEDRWGATLSNPGLAGSYAEAHNDYLQAAAEWGLPAAVMVVALLVMTFRRSGHPLLVAGAVAALAWFPMQRPITALVLLAAAGAGLASSERKRSLGALLCAALVVPLVVPELPRYAAERRLHRITSAIRIAASRPEYARAFPRISADAERLRTYPGDWRPLHAAGSAAFYGGDSVRAVELFERANALGERPEIDANLVVALRRLGDHARARELYERATRISPVLRAVVPAQ